MRIDLSSTYWAVPSISTDLILALDEMRQGAVIRARLNASHAARVHEARLARELGRPHARLVPRRAATDPPTQTGGTHHFEHA
jgi:hypothetical protein